MDINGAAVVLHLQIRVKRENHDAFRRYVDEAFPIFEAQGGCRGMVYVDPHDPESFDEVFYYATVADYEAGEQALHMHEALLARWRALLEAPPQVTVDFRWTACERPPQVASAPQDDARQIEGLTHRMTNCIASVIGVAELIEDGLTGEIGGETREYLHKLLQNAEEMKSLSAAIILAASRG